LTFPTRRSSDLGRYNRYLSASQQLNKDPQVIVFCLDRKLQRLIRQDIFKFKPAKISTVVFSVLVLAGSIQVYLKRSLLRREGVRRRQKGKVAFIVFRGDHGQRISLRMKK